MTDGGEVRFRSRKNRKRARLSSAISGLWASLWESEVAIGIFLLVGVIGFGALSFALFGRIVDWFVILNGIVATALIGWYIALWLRPLEWCSSRVLIVGLPT